MIELQLKTSIYVTYQELGYEVQLRIEAEN